MADEEKAKIVSDEDWKTQAKREKEKLVEESGKAEGEEAGDAGAGQAEPGGPLPPANFMTLVNSIVMQVLYCLGRLAGPDGAEPNVNLDLAKHHIDMLDVLEEKTKGNLTKEEEAVLQNTLNQVRMAYVKISE